MADINNNSNDNGVDVEEEDVEGDIFIVEKIVNKGTTKEGQTIYRVRWEGYGPDADTWEPIENLQNCLSLLDQFDQERNKQRKKRKGRSHGTFTIGPPPPLRDGTFWKDADEGILKADKESIYEKVKKRKRSSLNENDLVLNSKLLKQSDVFAADSDSDDGTEGTISPPPASTTPPPHRGPGRPFKDPNKERRDSHIKDTISDVFAAVVEQKKPKIDISHSKSKQEAEKPRKKLSAESSTTDSSHKTVTERKRDKSDKCVRFADETTQKAKIKTTLPLKENERLDLKKLLDSKKPTTTKKVVDCPIDWNICVDTPPSSETTPKFKSKKLSLPTPSSLIVEQNLTDEARRLTSIDAISASSSPDVVVDIGLDSNGNGSLENLSPELRSPDVAVQKIEVLEKSFNDAFDYLDKKEDEKKTFFELKRLYGDVKNQIERLKNYVYPVTYLLNDEEKEIIWQNLRTAIFLHDYQEVERILMQYRSNEFGIDDLHEGKTLLMICSMLKCKASDHAQCDTIRFFVHSGADVNKSVPNNGETALMIAAKKGYVCKIKCLVNLGAKIDLANELGETALFLAIRKCPDESATATIKTLLAFGTDYSLENKNGSTAMKIAEHLKKPNLVSVLNDNISKLENDFNHYLESVTNNSIQILDKMLSLRCLQVKTNGSWTFNFNVKELVLPEGYGVCLFLALAEFDEKGVKFLSKENIPVRDVFLNEKALSSLTNGTKDVLWLEPIQYGNNSLVVAMSESKHNLAKLIVQANIIRVTGSLADEQSANVERQG